jgi:hypothetical protein
MPPQPAPVPVPVPAPLPLPPLVLLVDLDGTVLGDVTPHVLHFTIDTELTHRRHNTSWLALALRGGLLRPGFANFVRGVAAQSGHKVELFIYTASTPQWAKVVVGAIEAEVGLRFNRPLLTRDDCLEGTSGPLKSLALVRTKILRSLHKRYPQFTDVQLRDRLMLIDNTPGVLAETHLQVLCPSYQWRGPHDPVFSAMSPQDVVTHLPKLSVLLRTYFPSMTPPPAPRDGGPPPPLELLGAYQQCMARYARHSPVHSGLDDFWTKVIRALRLALKRTDQARPIVRLLNQVVQRPTS